MGEELEEEDRVEAGEPTAWVERLSLGALEIEGLEMIWVDVSGELFCVGIRPFEFSVRAWALFDVALVDIFLLPATLDSASALGGDLLRWVTMIQSPSSGVGEVG